MHVSDPFLNENVSFAFVLIHLCLNICFKVSNEVPEQPVISPVSGYVYEKRLLLKYINETGTDPMNNQALNVDQLIEMKGKFL